ncbi:hypothetical protein ACFS4T_17890 [Pseudomonas lini]
MACNSKNNEIEQAATAVNEMTAAVEEVARNAVSTSEASNQSTQAAREGRDRVVETVDAIQTMTHDVQKHGVDDRRPGGSGPRHR